MQGIFTNPNWIQAIATVLLVVLTGGTLIVLYGYAMDTKAIANASILQIQNAQMPFLAIVKNDNTRLETGGWVLKNQGFGTAINIRHSEPGGSGAFTENVNPLAKGDSLPLAGFDINVMRNHVFTAEYESLSGTKYHTVVAWKDEVMQTTFRSVGVPSVKHLPAGSTVKAMHG